VVVAKLTRNIAYNTLAYVSHGWAFRPKVTARLVTTNGRSPYVMVADTLGDIHAALPPGLERSDRQPAEPPEVVESGSRNRPGRGVTSLFQSHRRQASTRQARERGLRSC
jgi:hypothetical protein